jgi:hypothetical protein
MIRKLCSTRHHLSSPRDSQKEEKTLPGSRSAPRCDEAQNVLCVPSSRKPRVFLGERSGFCFKRRFALRFRLRLELAHVGGRFVRQSICDVLGKGLTSGGDAALGPTWVGFELVPVLVEVAR